MTLAEQIIERNRDDRHQRGRGVRPARLGPVPGRRRRRGRGGHRGGRRRRLPVRPVRPRPRPGRRRRSRGRRCRRRGASSRSAAPATSTSPSAGWPACWRRSAAGDEADRRLAGPARRAGVASVGDVVFVAVAQLLHGRPDDEGRRGRRPRPRLAPHRRLRRRRLTHPSECSAALRVPGRTGPGIHVTRTTPRRIASTGRVGHDRARRGFGYQPALDGVRAWPWPSCSVPPGLARGGYLGVSVFFTLSGYLITSLAGRAGPHRPARRPGLLPPPGPPAAAGEPGLPRRRRRPRRGRRVRRRRAPPPGPVGGAAQVHNWVALSSDQTYADLFAAGRHPSPLDHFWSLAIEEQFYWVWPLVMVAVVAPRPSPPCAIVARSPASRTSSHR